MRESFIFYSSFFEAIEDLDDKKRLKMYDFITKFALKDEEPEKISGICKQLFALIKPQIKANNAKFDKHLQDIENGKRGAVYGKLGGRPKKNEAKKITPPPFSKNNPPENPINVNDNVNVNKNKNKNKNGEEKKPDPFTHPLVTFFREEHRRIMGYSVFMDTSHITKLIELSSNYDMKKFIPIALEEIKKTKWTRADGAEWKPTATWLFEKDNFAKAINKAVQKIADKENYVYEPNL